MSSKHLSGVVLGLAAIGSTAGYADTANVNVYGTLNLDYEYVNAAGANDNSLNYPGRFRLANNSSNFGVKGIEEFASGLKGVYQVELGFNLSTGAFTNTGAATNNVIGLRNSMIGLSGNFGTVSFGIWDTPFKTLTAQIDPWWGTSVGYMASMANQIGYNSPSSTFPTEGGNVAERASFDRRQGNAFQYWTPAYYNTTVRFMYSGNADRNVSSTVTPQNPDLLSSSIVYDDTTLLAGFSYEQHDDYFNGQLAPVTGVTADKSKDTAFKVAANYKFATTGTTFGGYWTYLRYRQTVGANDSSYSRNALVFVATQAIDAFTIRAGFGKAFDGSCSLATGAPCNTNGLGAKQMSLGSSYSLSARTWVYALYSKIWNGNGNYNFLLNGVDAPLPNGADPQAFGLGIRHTF